MGVDPVSQALHPVSHHQFAVQVIASVFLGKGCKCVPGIVECVLHAKPLHERNHVVIFEVHVSDGLSVLLHQICICGSVKAFHNRQYFLMDGDGPVLARVISTASKYFCLVELPGGTQECILWIDMVGENLDRY